MQKSATHQPLPPIPCQMDKFKRGYPKMGITIQRYNERKAKDYHSLNQNSLSNLMANSSSDDNATPYAESDLYMNPRTNKSMNNFVSDRLTQSTYNEPWDFRRRSNNDLPVVKKSLTNWTLRTKPDGSKQLIRKKQKSSEKSHKHQSDSCQSSSYDESQNIHSPDDQIDIKYVTMLVV